MVLGSDGVLLADCCLLGNGRYPEVNRAHAALIVRAVNAHAALVEALQPFARLADLIDEREHPGRAALVQVGHLRAARDAYRKAVGG